MRARMTAAAALVLTALFAVGFLIGFATPAQAQGDIIHIVGKLIDTRVNPAEPVQGVKITVDDEKGKQIGDAVSNDKGTFSIPLGKGDKVLGETFTIRIDTASLPEGTALRNPKQVALKQTITITSDVTVQFPIGDNPNPPTSEAVQGLQLFIGGLVFSLLLAMASLGLSLIFGTTGLVNFAHGELITFGALMAYAVDALPGTISIGGQTLTIYIGIVVAIIFSGAFGFVQDRVLWRPLRKRGTGVVAAMIVSIGLSIFLRNVYQFFAGADNHSYSQYTTPEPWHIGAVLITPKAVGVAIFAAIVLVVVTLALQRTRMGKATRAVADNPALAASSGINVDRVISVVWTGGAALAGLSGVLLGMTQGFDYQVGFKLLLLVFAAVVLGGLGTIWGAIAGSLIIGTFIEVSTLVIPSELKFVGALAVLIIILLIRPQGLLGRAQRVG